MKKSLLTIVAALLSLTAVADGYDLNKPFGFCTVSSRTDASSTYDITGGGCYTYPIPDGFTGKVIPLKSNGLDMKEKIENAIKQNDVVILDGADGDFIVSSNVKITVSNKTIVGINNARICTQWSLTDEIRNALNEAGVPSMSTIGGGGTLPNGKTVSEEAEYNTRKIIIELTGDNSENYRNSGAISLAGCQNIIIRNITFVGPGSVDVGGADLISSNSSAKNVWVDHCTFMDGMDGNFDITQKADFHTVSWCIFKYTSRSYMHQNTNLIGSSESEATGYLNTTFAFNWWGPGCKQRMPMARVGKIHMLNNYFSSTTAGNCINPRTNSEFLIEGNYFAAGVKRFYQSNDATAVTWADNNYSVETNAMGTPTSFGTKVTVPYEYTVATTADIPEVVQENAGATLPYGDNSGEQSENISGSVSWSFDAGVANQTPTVASAISAGIASTAVTIGEGLSYNGTQNITGLGKETKIRATIPNASGPAASNAITFTVTPAAGYKFKGTNVAFTATKIGTDGGKLDVSWNDTQAVSLATELTPKRNSTPSGKPAEDPFYTEYSFNIKNESSATENPCSLIIYLYALGQEGSLKDYGFCNIIIKGELTDATGISTPVTLKMKGDGTIYNLMGQKVDSSYKGIVIKNGKKYIQK